MYSISATPCGSFFFYPSPPPLLWQCFAYLVSCLRIGTSQCSEDDTSFCHSLSSWHPVTSSCSALAIHLPKTNSVPQQTPDSRTWLRGLVSDLSYSTDQFFLKKIYNTVFVRADTNTTFPTQSVRQSVSAVHVGRVLIMVDNVIVKR